MLNLGYQLSWQKSKLLSKLYKEQRGFILTHLVHWTGSKTSQPHTAPNISLATCIPKCPKLSGAEVWVQTSQLETLAQRQQLNVIGDSWGHQYQKCPSTSALFIMWKIRTGDINQLSTQFSILTLMMTICTDFESAQENCFVDNWEKKGFAVLLYFILLTITNGTVVISSHKYISLSLRATTQLCKQFVLKLWALLNTCLFQCYKRNELSTSSSLFLYHLSSYISLWCCPCPSFVIPDSLHSPLTVCHVCCLWCT